MINSCVLVGKVKEMPEIKTTAKGTSVAHLVLEADRPFRNEDGTLSADIFNVTLWKGIAEETASICKPGDLIGIRGRMQANAYVKDERTYYNCEVIAEKVAFLSKRMEALQSAECR
ncbi:MAG: single-stranded DNA-binding protein [Erysipelotrichia bacterium]|nr:single-stranded DNA-binding protein [Erysipelotrichia bacterium]